MSSPSAREDPAHAAAAHERPSNDVKPRRAFIAGATGFTGRALARQEPVPEVQLKLQVRPQSSSARALQSDSRVIQISLQDEEALDQALGDCDTIVQLIGTVKKKFDAHTSYESVDFGTTVTLLNAAKRQHIEHFVLLSSVGAGFGMGEYLRWKKKTEHAVIEEAAKGSGLRYTILRPAYLAGDTENSDRAPAKAMGAFFGGMADTPFGAPFAAVRPMPIQILAQLILEVVRGGGQNEILVGDGLFRIARRLGLLARSSLDALR